MTTVPSSHLMFSPSLQTSLNHESSWSTASLGATILVTPLCVHVPACSLMGQTLPVCCSGIFHSPTPEPPTAVRQEVRGAWGLVLNLIFTRV